ncbi:hypothetical protein ACQB60_10325 [Actinomycetota bacterium Odt1-20B]
MGEVAQVSLSDEKGAEPELRPWWRRLAPVWVNLLLGVPALVPLHSARLLLTEYRSCAFDSSGFGQTDCGGSDVIEGAGWARLGAVTLGGLGLVLVLLIDVLVPAARRRRIRPWLLGAFLVPVPYLGTLAVLGVLAVRG